MIQANGGLSRLWSFEFDDMANPEQGGVARWLLDGTQNYSMFAFFISFSKIITITTL